MTQDPTRELAALKQRERELTNGLEAAHRRKDFTRRDLDDARNRAAGHERSNHPQDKAIFEEAKARVAELQERLQIDNGDIAALESQLAEARAALAGLFEGDTGHQNAVTLYRRAKADAARADEDARAFAGRQAAASQALSAARQAQDRARQARQAALEPAAVAKARAALEQAQRETEDAETLVSNLKRQGERLQADQNAARATLEDARTRLLSTQAARLAERFAQRALDPALDAFAAARLAGSGFSFREFVADALDPRREFVPQAAEAHQSRLLAELDTLTGEDARGT